MVLYRLWYIAFSSLWSVTCSSSTATRAYFYPLQTWDVAIGSLWFVSLLAWLLGRRGSATIFLQFKNMLGYLLEKVLKMVVLALHINLKDLSTGDPSWLLYLTPTGCMDLCKPGALARCSTMNGPRELPAVLQITASHEHIWGQML